jgi:hypothetical protein
MAQINHLLPKRTTSVDGMSAPIEAPLAANLEECVSGIASTGSELFRLARQLETCIESLNVVTSALHDPLKKLLREEAQLLRGELALAVGELNHTIEGLPDSYPGLKLVMIDTFAALKEELNRNHDERVSLAGSPIYQNQKMFS